MGKAGRGMLTNKDQYIAQRAVFNPVITMYNPLAHKTSSPQEETVSGKKAEIQKEGWGQL